MSWTEYTHAKHFGSGIYRPYSDFLADALLELDNLLAAAPALARHITPFPSRDTLLVIGESSTLWAISASAHRHYPLFVTYQWPEFWDFDEVQWSAAAGLSSTTARALALPELSRRLVEQYSFVDPVVIAIPSLFQPQPNTPEAEIRTRSARRAAELLWNFENPRYEKMLELERPKEIFLSHKSVDKALVREVARTLSVVGFQPWLDEDKMKAGANLERAIRDGFTSSCAAVFFVTPNFVDDGFLATEIDYALAEKRQKGERFAIITLLLQGADGTFGTVPLMIRQFVWKQVQPAEVVGTIVESLPIKMDRVVWRQ